MYTASIDASHPTAGFGLRGLAPKFFAVIGLLALLSGALAAISMSLLSQASHDLASTDALAQRAMAAGRATGHVLQLARGVEYLPLELTPEQRRSWETVAEQELRGLEQRLDDLDRTLVFPESRQNLARVRKALDTYTPIGIQVRDLSRNSKFEEATALALHGAPAVAEMQDQLRAIEDRIRTVMRDAVTKGSEHAAFAQILMISLAAGGSFVAIGFALVIVLRGITGPLRSLSGTARSLAAGQLDIAIAGTDRKDEVGSIARGLETLRGSALHARQLEAEAKALEQRNAEDARKNRHLLADRVETQLGSVMTSLATASQQLDTAIGAVTGTAEEATTRAASVATAAGQASANVQTVSAAAEQLASSVAEITRQVTKAAKVARQAVDEATATDTMVSSLNDAAGRIGAVVQLIGQIAGQTNLLALNATIEAARAGEAGKGFAVVASEVKQLASQTGRATEEISQQIKDIQSATGRAVQSIRGIAGVVNEVDQIAASIAAAVEEQGAATTEIARSVSEAAIGTDQVSTNIGHVSQGMAATRGALGAMRTMTGEVSRQNTTLRGEMETLTRSLRAA